MRRKTRLDSSKKRRGRGGGGGPGRHIPRGGEGGGIVLRPCRKYCQFPVLPSSAEIRRRIIYFGIIRHSVSLSPSLFSLSLSSSASLSLLILWIPSNHLKPSKRFEKEDASYRVQQLEKSWSLTRKPSTENRSMDALKSNYPRIFRLFRKKKEKKTFPQILHLPVHAESRWKNILSCGAKYTTTMSEDQGWHNWK